MGFFCLFQLHKAFRNCSVLQFPLIFPPQFSVFASQNFPKCILSPTRRFALFRCVTLNQRANNGKRGGSNNCCWLLNAPARARHVRGWRGLGVAVHERGRKHGLWKEVSSLQHPDRGEHHHAIKGPGRFCVGSFF